MPTIYDNDTRACDQCGDWIDIFGSSDPKRKCDGCIRANHKARRKPVNLILGMTWQQADRQLRVGDCDRTKLCRVLYVLTRKIVRESFQENNVPASLAGAMSTYIDEAALLGQWPYSISLHKKRYSNQIAAAIRNWSVVSMAHARTLIPQIVQQPGDFGVEVYPPGYATLNTRYKILTALAVSRLRQMVGNIQPPLARPGVVTDLVRALAADPEAPRAILADAAEDAGYHEPQVLTCLRGERPALWAVLACLDRHPFQK